MKYKLIILLSILVSSSSYAQIIDAKHIEKRYKVSESSVVEISNKYGKVHIIQWDKDSVEFNIDVKVRGSNEEKVNKLMKTVDFDFTATKYYVIAQTHIKTGNSGFIGDIINIAESLANSDSYVEINYVVMMPSYIELKIDNKYGDVYIGDQFAPFKLNLSNGNFKGNKLTGDLDVTMKFGDATIREIQKGVINISYGSLEVDDAHELRVESKSSKIDIDGVELLRIDSRRDKINLKEVNIIRGTTNFSDIWIYQLYESTDLNMTYGSVNSDNTSNAFSLIKLVSSYTDVNLFFEAGSSFIMDLKLRETPVNYPKEMADIMENMVNKEEKRSIMTGTLGANPKSQVKIEAERGVINLYQR
jgi:hypothetical protein